MTGRRRACRPPSLLDALPAPGGAAAAPAARPATPAPPEAAAQRRILALHLPLLPTERLRLDQSEPAACWAAEGSRRLLTAVTRAAAAAGLAPGQAVADAQAILPGLRLIPAEPEADAAWLERLALWSLAVTPWPATDAPDGLLLDVTGIAHLHAPGQPEAAAEAALLRRVLARFARAGLAARGAIAGNPVAAAALARGTAEAGLIVPPGEDAAAILPLPLAALRLPPDQAAALHRLGVRQVGDALRLPRGPLARRFGAALTALLDTAAGRCPAPIRPLRPAPEFRVGREFLDPILTREAIDATLAALLELLCRQLAAAERGTRRLALLAFRVDGGVQEVAAESGLAQRDPAHFARLFRDRLERLRPGFGFEQLVLEAPATEPLRGAQAGLPGGEGGLPDRAQRDAAVARLLDRLAQRVAVWRPAPRASHWPERAVARVSAFERVGAPPPGWPGRLPRPLRLLRRPVPLQVMAVVPDSPPSLIRTPRASWRVTRAEGPERIAPEWWREEREQRPFRDYYRVELASGARLWVCRSGLVGPDGGPARWWLHGHFG